MSLSISKDFRPVVSCPECEKLVSARVVASYATSLAVDEGIEATTFYVLGRCPDCSNPFLLSRAGESDDWTNRDVWHAPVVLYPGTVASLDITVPKPLADSYLEAYRVYGVDGFTSCAIMCRRVLEGICSHFDAKGRNLYEMLSELKVRGIVDARLYEWANEALRALGNEAAHDAMQTVAKRDAKDVLDFTKAILEYLFMFAAAFESFKERRERRTQAKQPPPAEAPSAE